MWSPIVEGLNDEVQLPEGCEFCDPDHPDYDYNNCIWQTIDGEFVLSLETFSDSEGLISNCLNNVIACPVCGKKLS